MLLSALWQENQLTSRWAQQVERPAAPRTDAVGAGGTAGAVPIVPGASLRPAGSGAAAGIAFAIRVPRLDYFAAVRQGVSLDVLFAGPGHYPTTAMPGQRGNVGIAAHNTYWIAFGALEPGDLVILETRSAVFTYKIYGRSIVPPDNRTVLAPTTDRRLTLTTCWPLWAGALATQRLVFFAEELPAA